MHSSVHGTWRLIIDPASAECSLLMLHWLLWLRASATKPNCKLSL
uniref:Uncharacterized protein n=1 Tax=Anguilla anguilla TaxID=7936 RepID=A0A0E9TT47_ANGAN